MKRINEFNENDFTELKVNLIQSAKNYLGITNLPDENDLQIICDFLATHFKDFTRIEIVRALSMYANGTIIVYTQPYGVLSMKFLSEVLQEFRIIRKKENDLLKMRNENQKLLNEPVKNPDETNKNLYNWIVEYVKENKIIPMLYAWNEVYQHLEKIKIIDLSNDDKKDFVEFVRNEIMEQIKFYSNVPDKKNEMNELLKMLSNNFTLANYCRKKLVYLHLEKLIEPSKQNQNNGNNE